MVELSQLKTKYLGYPTIMGIDQEIILVKELSSIPEFIIMKEKAIFIDLIEILDESHCNGGIFEVTDRNLAIFSDFAAWLRHLAEQLDDKKFEWYSSDFEGKFDD